MELKKFPARGDFFSKRFLEDLEDSAGFEDHGLEDYATVFDHSEQGWWFGRVWGRGVELVEGWGVGLVEGWGVGLVEGWGVGCVEGWRIGHVVRAHSGILVVAYFGYVEGSEALTNLAEIF